MYSTRVIHFRFNINTRAAIIPGKKSGVLLKELGKTYEQQNGQIVRGHILTTGFDRYQFDMNYLLPHSARDFAPLPTVTVPLGHGIQLVFIA